MKHTMRLGEWGLLDFSLFVESWLCTCQPSFLFHTATGVKLSLFCFQQHKAIYVSMITETLIFITNKNAEYRRRIALTGQACLQNVLLLHGILHRIISEHPNK
jgi:hypothetical protein